MKTKCNSVAYNGEQNFTRTMLRTKINNKMWCSKRLDNRIKTILFVYTPSIIHTKFLHYVVLQLIVLKRKRDQHNDNNT